MSKKCGGRSEEGKSTCGWNARKGWMGELGLQKGVKFCN